MPLEAFTVHLDLLAAEQGRLPALAVTVEGWMLGLVPLAVGRSSLLFVPGEGPGARLAVAVSTPVEWMHLHDQGEPSMGRARPATLTSIGQQSVGLAALLASSGEQLVVAGTRAGGLLSAPPGYVWGVRFTSRPVWAYVCWDRLVVRWQGNVIQGTGSQGEEGLVVAALPDGSRVFSVWSVGDPRLSGGGAPGTVEMLSAAAGIWMGLVSPGPDGDHATLSWTSWEGKEHSVVLDASS